MRFLTFLIGLTATVGIGSCFSEDNNLTLSVDLNCDFHCVGYSATIFPLRSATKYVGCPGVGFSVSTQTIFASLIYIIRYLLILPQSP